MIIRIWCDGGEQVQEVVDEESSFLRVVVPSKTIAAVRDNCCRRRGGNPPRSC